MQTLGASTARDFSPIPHGRSKKAGRLEWVRGVVRFKDGKLMVWPTGGQSSHMLGGLAEANCLIQLPASQTHFEEGQEVMVELLNWNE